MKIIIFLILSIFTYDAYGKGQVTDDGVCGKIPYGPDIHLSDINFSLIPYALKNNQIVTKEINGTITAQFEDTAIDFNATTTSKVSSPLSYACVGTINDYDGIKIVPYTEGSTTALKYVYKACVSATAGCKSCCEKYKLPNSIE